MGYSKAPEQPQSSARPICHSHVMTRTGREPATICTAAYGARRATHYATGDDDVGAKSTIGTIENINYDLDCRFVCLHKFKLHHK